MSFPPPHPQTRPRIIAGWRSAWRLWSMRFATFGAALMAGWTSLPPDMRAGLPHADRIAALLFVAVALSRLVQQQEGAR